MRWPWSRRRRIVVSVDPDEWIMVPFRFAEAARLSIYTIASQKDMPDEVRQWIVDWLYGYNVQLAGYMRENYGPNIFPLLDRITGEVWPNYEPEHSARGNVDQDTWLRWEQEFRSGGNE